jgi:outer membrane protein OmpA-like peptidoglycan-associated protein
LIITMATAFRARDFAIPELPISSFFRLPVPPRTCSPPRTTYIMRRSLFSPFLWLTLLVAAAAAPLGAADAQAFQPAVGIRPPATPVINAYQVYLACRHPDAYRDQDGDAGKLYRFCRQNLPGRDQWLQPNSIAQWITSVPSATEIQQWATKSEQFNASARQAVMAAQTVRGNDETGGNLRFDPGSPGGTALTPDGALFLHGLVGRLSEQVRQGRAAGVVVSAPPDRVDVNAGRQMRLVAETLRGDTALSRVGVDTTRDAARDSLYRNGGIPDNAVTVHLVFTPQVMPAITALGQIRFDPSRANLDNYDIDVIAEAARQIIAAQVPAGMPIVVTGYADAATGKPEENARLAQQRAESIRAALASILRDHGISANQIVAQAEVLTGKAHNATVDQRETSRTGVISLGALPPAAAPVTVSSASAPRASTPLTPEGIATSAAQALANVATQRAGTLFFNFATTEVCGRYSDLLRQTCYVIRDSTVVAANPQLSFQILRELVQRDAEAMPTTLLSRAVETRFAGELASMMATPGQATGADVQALGDSLRRIRRRMEKWSPDSALAAFANLQTNPGYKLPEQVHRAGGYALVAAYGLDFARRVRDGEDPLAAVREFDAWKTEQFTRRPALGFLETSPAVRRVQEFTLFAARMDTATAQLRQHASVALVPDTIALYAIRTALVNEPALRGELAQGAAYLIQATRHIDEMRATLDSLRRELRKVQGSGSDAVEARQQLFATALGEIATHFYPLLADKALATPGMRDSVAAFATPVRNLYYALQARNVRAAFSETVVLIPRVVPSVIAARNCARAAVDECTRLGLSPQWLRVAALVSDVSAAQSEDEVRQTMQRFIAQGTDVDTKRTGPPDFRVFANGYATVTAEPGYKGIQLPLGFESVYRRSRGTPGMTVAGFLRLVELSGFLPRENQEGGRSTEDVVAALVRPGAYLVLAPLGGQFRSVTLGAGWAWWAERETQGERRAWEWHNKPSFFIGWDVPIFP